MCPNCTSSTAQARRCQRPRPWPKGLNAANKLTLAAKGKNFLLTFPLIEPAPLTLRVSQEKPHQTWSRALCPVATVDDPTFGRCFSYIHDIFICIACGNRLKVRGRRHGGIHPKENRN